MNHSARSATFSVGVAMIALICGWAIARPAVAQPAAPATPAAAGAAAVLPVATAEERGPLRKLAPGVMRTINPDVQLEETFEWHDAVELLADDPDLSFAKNASFRRDIWHLDFQCKPLRTIYVEVPQPGGLMARKQIRYLIYSVTNNGKALHPVAAEDGTFKTESVDLPVRFIPKFTLECPEYHDAYPDRVIPIAVDAIRQREDPNRQFYNSVEMCREIPVGKTVWGVATWEDVDPRIVRFSIYVQGLTNAYRWEDTEGVYKKGSPLGAGRRLLRKTLKLNYWRPGEEPTLQETEIPLGQPDEPDYEWIWRG
jgi:hypothetical protein